MVLFVIAACEVGFWVLLGLGLVARYLLRLRRTSTVLLLLVPVLDLVLVGASLLDVARGTPPGVTHGIAALYLGFTVAFGHSTIRWVDARFAHRFAGGPPPVRPPQHGSAKIAHAWREWSKAAVMAAIAAAVVALTAVVAGTGFPAVLAWYDDPLWSWAARAGSVAVVWFVVGPVWTSVAEAGRAPA